MLMFNRTKLKEGRLLKGYTLQEVADRLQIDLHAYWRLESGKTELKVCQLLKLTYILDKPLEYFLTAQYSIEDFKDRVNNLKMLYDMVDNDLLNDTRFSDGLDLLEQSLSLN